MNEGAPSTLQTLVRTDGLTKVEWNHILEQLRERINPFLDTITLDRVSDIRIAGSRNGPKLHGHRISEDLVPDRPVLTKELSKLVNLDTRGLFYCGKSVKRSDEYGFDFARCIWGINRNGEWMNGYVLVDHDGDNRGNCDYQTALALHLTPSDPDGIVVSWGGYSNLNLDYRYIWFEMQKMFDEIVEERKEKYEKVLYLQRVFQQEASVIRHISSKIKF